MTMERRRREMLNFNTATITEQGLALNTKVNAGRGNIIFTKLRIGAGTYEPDTDMAVLTGLKDPKQEVPFEKKEIKDAMTVLLHCTVNNEGVHESYLINEIGIFAQDPDNGEILYSIATAAGEADTMPAFSGENLVTISLDSYVTVSSSANVQINVQAGDWVTQEDLEKLKEEVKEDLQGVIDEEVKEQINEAQQQFQNQIDTKANKSILLSVIIPSTAWTGETAPYTVQVAVEELTGSKQELIEVFVQYEASFEQKTAWTEAGIVCGNNIKGAIILEALGEKPAVDIPIHILKRGDLGDNTSGAACSCAPITSTQIEDIVSGTYEPGEDDPAGCGCVPLSTGEIADITEG